MAKPGRKYIPTRPKKCQWCKKWMRRKAGEGTKSFKKRKCCSKTCQARGREGKPLLGRLCARKTCRKPLVQWDREWVCSFNRRTFCDQLCGVKDRPLSKKTRYRRLRLPDGRVVMTHRYVMELALGRALLPEESVHHKNGIKTDNRLKNLELWASLGQPAGQRVQDLIDFVVKAYPDRLLRALSKKRKSS